MATRRRSFGDVTLDPRNGWLICGKARVNIRPAVMRLFDALLDGRGQTQTAEVLRAAMRKPGNPPVSKGNLRVGIVDLRVALLTIGSATQVEARVGYGWRLTATAPPSLIATTVA
jgi:DNA-binding response OmpR family regulator